jgi:hypothetical protein
MPLLYRGLADPLPAEGRVEFIREDRRPRNSSMLMTLAFNLAIERKFGIPLVRRRSLFVTGDFFRAAPYAKESADDRYIGVVVPIGDFHYLYSPLIHDSYGLEPFLHKAFATAFKTTDMEQFSGMFADPATTTLSDVEAARQRYKTEHPPLDRFVPMDAPEYSFERRTNENLVPWERLDEGTRQYDRDVVLEAFLDQKDTPPASGDKR